MSNTNDARKNNRGNGDDKEYNNETNGAETIVGEAMIGHGEFFDPDGDGIFSPLDTFQGFRALGFSTFLSLFSTLVICTMSYPSLPAGHWLPDPLFRIHVLGLHKAKHGSDSGSFRRDGSVDDGRFDDFWNSHTDPPHEEITPIQLYDAVAERRLAYDFYGSFAAIFEWLATWILFGYPSFHFSIQIALQRTQELFSRKAESFPDTLTWRTIFVDTFNAASSGGNVKKEDAKSLYDGTAFYVVMNREVKNGNKWAQSWKAKHSKHGNRELQKYERPMY
ncbi:Caleosin related protein-domain-containing protein [Lentinula raphanica]|nr:Caleosin related protein-domain-containing protein [Lentinula raphanica]